MTRLADVLVSHSCKVQPGDRACVKCIGAPPEMACILIDRIAAAKAIPFAQVTNFRVSRSLYMHASAVQMQMLAEREMEFMRGLQHYICVVGEENDAELSDVPDDKMKLVLEHWTKPVTDYRNEKSIRWVVVRWPTPAMAQLAGMSTEAFEDYFFDVCTLDYDRMARAGAPLAERMMNADMIRIKDTLDTDVSFSIKGMPAVMNAGDRNIPDGELATAPVRDSMNGILHFNAATIYHGKCFDDIRLLIKNGKIIDATSSNTAALNNILDTDEGARYIGEFSLGLNPRINRVMRDAIFDEKIAGSMHLAPGQPCAESDNGNRSGIHWDMVLIQTPEFGGGEVYFDDELIRKDGRFVPSYLQCLNPENLL